MASFSKFKVLVAQSCPTLCNCLDRSLLDSSVHGILQARIVTGGGSHSLHGIFPTQESNLSLLNCRQILYHLSHQGIPTPHPPPFSKRYKSILCATESLDLRIRTLRYICLDLNRFQITFTHINSSKPHIDPQWWVSLYHLLFQFSSVAQSCPTLWDPVDCNIPGFPVLHHLPELAQTHVHRVGDAIQLSHPLSSPPAFNLSQHQGPFQ